MRAVIRLCAHVCVHVLQSAHQVKGDAAALRARAEELEAALASEAAARQLLASSKAALEEQHRESIKVPWQRFLGCLSNSSLGCLLNRSPEMGLSST